MENLTENAVLALNKVAIAKCEIEVFEILDEYNINHVEGTYLLSIFHEAHKSRQQALDEMEKKKRQLQLKRLREKKKYLQDLTDHQIEIFYAHLLYTHKEGHHPLLHEQIAVSSARKRAIKRGATLLLNLEKKRNIYVPRLGDVIEESTIYSDSVSPIDWNIIFNSPLHSFINKVWNCKKCDHLLECKC